jgi:hypothetical protein
VSGRGEVRLESGITALRQTEYLLNSESLPARTTLPQFGQLFLLTIGALCVHGFHPYVEDAEIYVPGIKQAVDPNLYPANQAFFASHASLTLFPNLVAASIRITHLSSDWALFLWHVVSIFLFLWACWRIGRLAFRDSRAAWGGAALVASLLTMPVAGTALYIMDQYLTTRALSTAATLWVIVGVVERQWLRAALWLLFAGLIHPLMVVFCLAYVVLWLLDERLWPEKESMQSPAPVAAMIFPLNLFPPVSDAYREVLRTRSYFFLSRWEWYEWLGIFGPLCLLEWFRRIARRHDLPVLERLCRTTIVFGAVFFIAALLISVPTRMAPLAKLQPLRALQLEFILLFIFAGGLLAKFVLKQAAWRWLLLFLPISAGMYYAQRQLFPATSHIEWPGATSGNPWVQAFLWVRGHTPANAFFALDPNYMRAPGEDDHGFRALAERSRMADRVKDSGAVSMFPLLADPWRAQVRALAGWAGFKREDFERLHDQFGVDWVIVQKGANPGLDCPYQNSAVMVCQVP